MSIPSDYKALVICFFGGGNDSYNMLVPKDTTRYNQYAASRGALALSNASLISLTSPTNTEGTYGLHPSLTQFAALFNAGDAAIMANVGTLLQPTTKSQYNSNTELAVPLFSHNDQTAKSQSQIPDAVALTGWGGAIGEILGAENDLAGLSPCISIAGSNLLQTGANSVPYTIGTSGVQILSVWNNPGGFFTDRRTQFRNAQDDAATSSHPLLASLGSIVGTSIDVADLVSTQLASSSNGGVSWPGIGTNVIADQLQMVTRCISMATELEQHKQVFFVQLNGFDAHNSLLTDQAGLLTKVDAALKLFFDALTTLGAWNKVTLATMSEFGRTLTNNGDGTDHGWGGNTLLMGGAVVGSKIYGTFPSLVLDSSDDIGQGRLIPTTSWDQYGATLAKWLGITTGDMSGLFPHLSRFSPADLGFLA